MESRSETGLRELLSRASKQKRKRPTWRAAPPQCGNHRSQPLALSQPDSRQAERWLLNTLKAQGDGRRPTPRAL